MKKSFFLFATALVVSSFANAQTLSYSAETSTNILLAPFVSTALATVLTHCAAVDCRQIAEAQDDAAEFLATNGQVRTAKLQNAFNVIRASDAALKASDLEIAEAILSLN